MTNKNKEAFNYDKAKQDIEQIMKELNDPELTITDLKKKVKQAVELIDNCKKALSETQEDLAESLSEDE